MSEWAGEVAKGLVISLTELPPEREAEFQRIAAEEQARREEDERIEVGRRRREALIERDVPLKEVDRILASSYLSTLAMDAGRRFMQAPDQRLLILSGGTGCGKTTAAAWVIAQEAPELYGGGLYRRYAVNAAPRPEPWPSKLHPRFIAVSRLVRVSITDRDQVELLERCSMLALDDLGMEHRDQKGWFLAVLDSVLDARYEAGLRTVITTNLPAPEFKERYGGRIVDRVREVGSFVSIDEVSLRGRR